MAKLGDIIKFTGSIGDLIAYRLPGSSEIFVRARGGTSRHKLKTHKNYEQTRKNNREFGGRSSACKWINSLFAEYRDMVDFSYMGRLNKLIKPIQELDKVSEPGKRNILFTRNPGLLEGFKLSVKQGIDSVIMATVDYHLIKEEQRAIVRIPELLPGENFDLPERCNRHRFVTTLGILPDIICTDSGYVSVIEGLTNHFVFSKTEWIPSWEKTGAQEIELKLPWVPASNSYSLVLVMGIQFGYLVNIGPVHQKATGGAAKIALVR